VPPSSSNSGTSPIDRCRRRARHEPAVAIASRLVSDLSRGGVERVKHRVQHHIVIRGWNSEGIEILRERHAREHPVDDR
jgi:hypothetical protein